MYKSFDRLVIDRLPGFCVPEEKTLQARAAPFTPRASSGEKSKGRISPQGRGGYITTKSRPGFSRRSSGSKAGGAGTFNRGPIGVVVSQNVSDQRFLRGDVNQDGQVSMLDANALLKYFYTLENEPPCLESADVNNDGEVLLGDALQLISYVTYGLSQPAPPFPSCARDPDEAGGEKDIGCISYQACPGEGGEQDWEED